jgi:hypothetical protein
MHIKYSCSFFQSPDVVDEVITVPPTFIGWNETTQKNYLLGNIKSRNLRSLLMNQMSYEVQEENP